tara:strand:- start:352 stop:951 length:600 start_codon:yes stop_codon:yes gene_type:complete
MRGINELAEDDAKWRTIAAKITGNKASADDLVQDMYLKLMEVDKDINDYYVTLTLKSLFIDGIRKSKIDSHDIGMTNEEYTIYGAATWEEAEDNASKKYRPRQAMVTLKDWMDVSSAEAFEADDEEQALLDVINAQPYIDREMLEESYDRSIREIAEFYGINYGLVHKRLHRILDASLGDAKEELYNNSNMKIRKAKKE